MVVKSCCKRPNETYKIAIGRMLEDTVEKEHTFVSWIAICCIEIQPHGRKPITSSTAGEPITRAA